MIATDCVGADGMETNAEPGAAERFAANLRMLCERHGPITSICRKIGLNRQQFNKYLSGVHAPSPRNARAIAHFFGLSPAIMLADPDEVRTLVDGNYFAVLERLRGSPQFSAFVASAVLHGKDAPAGIAGVYDRYQYSSIYRGAVLRSSFCVYRNHEFYQHAYVERFPSLEDAGKAEYVFKYHGFSFPVAGKVFCFDFESVQQNEITTAVFTPVQRSKTRFLFGIATGVAATMSREPFATKVALHYRHPGLIGREDLKRLTTLAPADPSIPREVLHYLGDGADMLIAR
ncbi:hypothetical protein FHT98_5189 [Bosea sp. AK1]|nr:hypothetical protein FHT98_5189 [Bosea sp. AK1]